MTGIPGSSKGCITCRRRKVRCDLEKLSCARCVKGGRVCEGYERYPVFLNRTAQGANKRHRLDEAKPKSLSGPVQIDVAARDWRQMIAAVAKSEDNRILSQLSATPAFDSQIIALFFERYLPVDKSTQNAGRCWLRQAVGLPNPGEALHLSLKAISMTRLGRLFEDERLAFQGGTCYGVALQQLRKALQSEVAVRQDETLAAGFILALYELFESESATSSMQAWSKHMSGLEKLVSMRGPQLYRSHLGQDMLENIRSSLMISCLEHRRTSVLAYGRWLARPWDATSNSIHPRVHDKGFALAALLQEIDKANLSSADSSISIQSHCLQRAIDMDIDLDNWYEEFLIRSPSPSYWPQSPSNFTRAQQHIAGSGPRGLPLFCYANLMVASITVTFWALKLILSGEIATICLIISSNNRKACADPPTTDPAASLTLILMAQRAENQHNEAKRVKVATDIVRSMPYCLNHTMGLLGPEKAFFALRTALATLRRHPGPELEWCREAHRRMDSGPGTRGAMQLHPFLYGSCGSQRVWLSGSV